MCQKLWKLAGSRQSYWIIINSLLFGPPCIWCVLVVYLIYVVVNTRHGQTSTPVMIFDRSKTNYFGVITSLVQSLADFFSLVFLFHLLLSSSPYSLYWIVFFFIFLDQELVPYCNSSSSSFCCSLLVGATCIRLKLGRIVPTVNSHRLSDSDFWYDDVILSRW